MADTSVKEKAVFTTDPARIEEAATLLGAIMTEAAQTDLLESSKTMDKVLDVYTLLIEKPTQS